MQKYRLISKKGEGTFSEVLKAQSIKTGKYVAIKCMKNHFESIEQVSVTRIVIITCSPNSITFMGPHGKFGTDLHIVSEGGFVFQMSPVLTFLTSETYVYSFIGQQLERDPSPEASITSPSDH